MDRFCLWVDPFDEELAAEPHAHRMPTQVPEKEDPDMQLNTARVFVRNLTEAQVFYEQSLELPLQAGRAEDGFCVFGAGPCQLVIEKVTQEAPQEEQVLVGRFTGLSFTVSDIHAKHRELRARGVSFTGELELQFWGGTLATFCDPAGNEIQLVEHPPSA